MRILTFIIILLLQGISLFASADRAMLSEEVYNAVPSEEVTASWERESDAILLGGRVLSDFRNKKELCFTVNASCSPESIEKIILLRKLAVDIISSSVLNGKVNCMAMFAGSILLKIDSVSLTPLTMREKELAASVEKINIIKDNFYDGGFSSAAIPHPEYAVSPSLAAVSFSSFHKLKFSKDKKNEERYTSKKILCRKNLYDNEFADLYRLFLYVKDNSGNAKPFILTYNSLTRFSLLFFIRSLQPLYNLTRYKNTSKTLTGIIQPGVSL